LPVIVSTHPRTRKRIEALDQSSVVSRQSSVDNLIYHPTAEHQPPTADRRPPTGILFLRPFGFLDYVHLQQHAKCVISDSGTISEESAILGFPAISLRQSMERPEAQDAGTIILTGFDPDIVLQSIALVISEFETNRNQYPSPSHPVTQSPSHIPEEYQVTDTSWRVLKLIMGNARLSNIWWGIK